MPRTYTEEELESVRLQQIADQAQAQDRARTALQPGEGQLKLYHPGLDSLKFGPGTQMLSGPDTTPDLIQFGQVEPGVAIVAADHPLLPALLKRHPKIIVLEPGEVIGRTYACEDCDKEFTTKRKLKAHRASAHRPAKEPEPAPTPRASQKQAAPSSED